MRNRLYLLLPITGSESTCKEEGVYLTSLTTDYNSFLTGVFKTILHIYTHEDFNVYYDPSRLSALLNAAKQENEGQYTEAHKLLRLLAKKDFREYADIYKQTSPITVNGVHIAQGILNAYIALSSKHDTLINSQCLHSASKYLNIIDANTKHRDAVCIDCNCSTIHNWFIDNRTPKRILDANYDKHQTKERESKHGIISALTYSKDETESLMHQAIKCGKNLFLKDNIKAKLIIFWSENLTTPTYHAYEVSADDKSEIDKIFKKGGREVYNLIETYSIR